jgi:hypothetical protein
MNTRHKIIILAVLALFLAAGCSNSSNNSNQTSSGVSQESTTTQASGGQKFIDQSYYKSSYLISGDTLSADAKNALTGFSMDKQTLADGSTQITLTAKKSGYHDQQYTLHSGDQLYFIEKFLGDDNTETNEEKNNMDDSAVVVNSQGNVVIGPTVWATDSASSTPGSK